jgi:hypothetical protein
MRMACELLFLPLRLILSAQGQKAEAKPVDRFHRGRSQGAPAMERHEVACLPSGVGLPLGRSRGRETPSLSKSVRSASFKTGRAVAHAVSDALMAPVRPAITHGKRNVHRTDEVPRCPRSSGIEVRRAYKSHTKGPPEAPATGRASPPPRPQGCRQRQSRGAGPGRLRGQTPCSERQNLRVPRRPLRFMDPVSPAAAATKWPGGTSSPQPAGSLRNRSQQPQPGFAAVRVD